MPRYFIYLALPESLISIKSLNKFFYFKVKKYILLFYNNHQGLPEVEFLALFSLFPLKYLSLANPNST